MKKQSPAEVVIGKFGTATYLAKLLRRNRSTVSRWKLSKRKGGTAGKIPSAYHVKILKLADKHGIKLKPEDLIIGRPA